MKKRLFSTIIGSAALMLHTVNAENSKPNIIFILADDMGIGDVSFLNPDAKLSTPNIDSIGENGMAFTDAHTSSAVCTPTRYGLMTGRYNWRSELKFGVLQGYSRALIAPGRDTVATLLKRNGYNTAMFGKWHLGLNWQLKDGSIVKDLKPPKSIESEVDFSKPFTGGPCDHGFDSWYGINASLDFPPYVMIENDHTEQIPTVKRKFQGGKGALQIMMRGGLQAADFKADQVLSKLTQRAVKYISEYKSEKPFFIYMPFNAPHTPVVPRKKFLASSQCGIYGDFIQELDWSVGEVLKTLKEKGVLDNTLIIFTADNGSSKMSFPLDLEAKYNHHPSFIYKGRKASLSEGGHRVPFLVQWPKKVAPGSRCDKLSNLNDFYATCADIVKSDIAPNAGEDSYSFLPVLEGNEDGYLRTNAIHHDFGGGFAFRDGKWKIILSKYNKRIQLFNLETDIGETHDLSNEFPEVVEKLRNKLTKIIEDGRTTPGPKQQNDGEKHWKQLYWIPNSK